MKRIIAIITLIWEAFKSIFEEDLTEAKYQIEQEEKQEGGEKK